MYPQVQMDFDEGAAAALRASYRDASVYILPYRHTLLMMQAGNTNTYSVIKSAAGAGMQHRHPRERRASAILINYTKYLCNRRVMMMMMLIVTTKEEEEEAWYCKPLLIPAYVSAAVRLAITSRLFCDPTLLAWGTSKRRSRHTPFSVLGVRRTVSQSYVS